MFLGTYEFTGDPPELLAAYDRLMTALPTDSLVFHACVERRAGVLIIDTCPNEEVFTAFSSSPEFLGALTAVGLPAPLVTKIGNVHSARSRDLVITG